MKRFEDLPQRFQNDAVKEYYDILSKKKITLFFKKTFDFLVALILFVLVSPVFIAIAIAVKVTSKGEIIFKQKRVGKYGKEFYVLKFRTMITDAEKLGKQITVGERDPRITKIGHFLRKFRLDEFPQLINVLKGEMSFVGARPEVPYYVDFYTDEMMATLLTEPGITGTASIFFKDEAKMLEIEPDAEKCYINHILPEKMRLNLEYLRNLTVFYDIKLMFQTVFEVSAG
ncbi:MAG: sugar transferase [Clostridia bacterium]|nr:sugar transferase [Clostridia bacterium]